MPTEKTSTEALAFAEAHYAVDRALGASEETKEAAFNAFLGFKRLSAQYGVSRDITTDIKDLLARAWLRVDNAQRLLDDRMQKAKEVRGALRNVNGIRALLDAIRAAALRSYWIDIADPRWPPAEVFLGLEEVREFLREYPELEAAARALYGFSTQRIRGVGVVQRGTIRWFAYESSQLVVNPMHASLGRFTRDLIGPVLGADWLQADDVRKYRDAHKR
jgi:hypothetical protein